PGPALTTSESTTKCDRRARARRGPAGASRGGRPRRRQFPWRGLLPWLLGLFGSFGGGGAPDEGTLLGSGGIGWLGLVPGSSHTGSPPTFAGPRPGGSANHSSAGAFIRSSAEAMKACHAGAAVKIASAPGVMSVLSGLPNQKADA